MSAVKEPKFFLTDGPPPTRGGPGDVRTYREHVWRRDDYEALFDQAPAAALRGESTPFYLYDSAAQLRIRALVPHARLILILRDPVERAHSNWAHLWSAGLDPVGDVVRACAEEERRIAAGWADFWRYTALGRYGEQLEHLYTVFPRDQVMVFRYRALIEEPARVLDRICDFLGVADGILTEAPGPQRPAAGVLSFRPGQSGAGPVSAARCAARARRPAGSARNTSARARPRERRRSGTAGRRRHAATQPRPRTGPRSAPRARCR
jgi:Sulfotransferase domain